MKELSKLRSQIRLRAGFACEFCGVEENSVGGQLTLDHFRPKSKGGQDTLENLLYCCVRCNQFKQNYWPSSAEEPRIWNPLKEPASTHFIEVPEGTLLPLTKVGKFTIERLRLNRMPLVAYRQNKRTLAEAARLIDNYKKSVQLLSQSNRQLAVQVREQRQLLEAQRNLIRLLLDQQN